MVFEVRASSCRFAAVFDKVRPLNTDKIKIKLNLRVAMLYGGSAFRRLEMAPVIRFLGRSTQNRHRSSRAIFMNLSKQRTQKPAL